MIKLIDKKNFKNSSSIEQFKKLFILKRIQKPLYEKGSSGFVLNTNLHQNGFYENYRKRFRFIIIPVLITVTP